MNTNEFDDLNNPQSVNLGTRRLAKLRMADFPNAETIVREGLPTAPRSEEAVDIMLVNPPTPDGELWIRTQHRVGRRTRENMVWPQVSLAQMAALLHPVYTVKVVDCNAERIRWPEFTKLLDLSRARAATTRAPIAPPRRRGSPSDPSARRPRAERGRGS